MMNTTHRRMYPHLFLELATVNSKEHSLQVRAARAGCTTLAEYHAFRRANS
ncbi:hypothetical protein BJD66_gp31 [Gordonia phage Emalyn]|uniref:Uncharacterized protein n=1 Tax=Gordonia phage Emalyn TaxID=1821552 RepID=A0A142KBW7_9CAUD|nr:hypothetical protein BJD66_gp31 [Gordonia phage Emalyn]AMS03600.1 hypothetical protein SEA_EMALYN_31 [Gordonia phage Emalyn]QXN73600.1 hypothetical protein SEA_AIKOCARSON_32 [Gordonia phage AikoCarson]